MNEAWKPTHRHFKGGYYRVIGHGLNSETIEPMVIYENEESEWWIRPFGSFYGLVDGKPRFARVGE